MLDKYELIKIAGDFESRLFDYYRNAVLDHLKQRYPNVAEEFVTLAFERDDFMKDHWFFTFSNYKELFASNVEELFFQIEDDVKEWVPMIREWIANGEE